MKVILILILSVLSSSLGRGIDEKSIAKTLGDQFKTENIAKDRPSSENSDDSNKNTESINLSCAWLGFVKMLACIGKSQISSEFASGENYGTFVCWSLQYMGWDKSLELPECPELKEGASQPTKCLSEGISTYVQCRDGSELSDSRKSEKISIDYFFGGFSEETSSGQSEKSDSWKPNSWQSENSDSWEFIPWQSQEFRSRRSEKSDSLQSEESSSCQSGEDSESNVSQHDFVSHSTELEDERKAHEYALLTCTMHAFIDTGLCVRDTLHAESEITLRDLPYFFFLDLEEYSEEVHVTSPGDCYGLTALNYCLCYLHYTNYSEED